MCNEFIKVQGRGTVRVVPDVTRVRVKVGPVFPRLREGPRHLVFSDTVDVVWQLVQ